MAAEDYFDIDGDPFDGCPDDEIAHTAESLYGKRYKPKQPDDFPCRKCSFSSIFYRCRRTKGVDRCPGAKWFQEHNNRVAKAVRESEAK